MFRSVANILIITISASLSGEIIDFGVVGKTQPIIEVSLRDKFQKAIKDVNLSKMKQGFESSVYELHTSKSNLPLCEKNASRLYEPGITLTKDYFTPDGRLYAKAGDKINPLKKMANFGYGKKTIAIIDGSSQNQTDLLSKYCQKPQDCIVFLSSGNTIDYSKKFGFEPYPLPPLFASSIGAKCAMSIIVPQENVLTIKEIKADSSPSRGVD